jgi:hypothetical protein
MPAGVIALRLPGAPSLEVTNLDVVSGSRRTGEKAVAIELAHRFEQISAKAYEHPADRAATSALHSVPLLDKVIKRLSDLGHERRLRQMVMGNAVHLGTDQVPDVWTRYVQCTSILDLDSVPDLYMINNPTVNAMAIGAKTPIVVVNSSLIGSYSPDEIQTVLGHELGHVLSEHNYYSTALLLLKQFMEGPFRSPFSSGFRFAGCTSPSSSGRGQPNSPATGRLHS